MDRNQRGCLLIKPICAKLIHDAETFGQMNPYCLVTVGGQTLKTEEAMGAGKFPNWHDDLEFNSSVIDKATISIFHKDSLNREIKLGENQINIQKIMSNPDSDD